MIHHACFTTVICDYCRLKLSRSKKTSKINKIDYNIEQMPLYYSIRRQKVMSELFWLLYMYIKQQPFYLYISVNTIITVSVNDLIDRMPRFDYHAIVSNQLTNYRKMGGDTD